MRLGKTIFFGAVATMLASHAHGLFACELRPASKTVAGTVRKPAKLVPFDRIIVERPARAEYLPLPSRRIILQ